MPNYTKNNNNKTSIPYTFEMTEAVDKPLQSFFCRDVGVIAGIPFSTTKFHCRLNYKSKDNSTNYYNPYSHNRRL